MKREIRVVGIDDAPFEKFVKRDVLVVGTFFRGGTALDGVLSTKVRVDGRNSTAKITEMINSSKFKPQLQCIMLDGVAVGGFNVVDTQMLSKATGIPVMTVMRHFPDYRKIIAALKKIGKLHLLKIIEKAGPVRKVGNIHIQYIGMDFQTAKEILKITCTRSYIPEPIRIAHIIAGGITEGESRGRA
jgi:endonuclease V-like protein UPF0215 family